MLLTSFVTHQCIGDFFIYTNLVLTAVIKYCIKYYISGQIRKYAMYAFSCKISHFKTSMYVCIYVDSLSDFSDGVQNFMVIGDSLRWTTFATIPSWVSSAGQLESISNCLKLR